jgi:hypothetical protein
MMKSARFIAQEFSNMSTSDVYECLKDMGLVVKDKLGDWMLTDQGRSIGGKMSKSDRCPVPTFDEKITDMIIEFCKKRFG